MELNQNDCSKCLRCVNSSYMSKTDDMCLTCQIQTPLKTYKLDHFGQIRCMCCQQPISRDYLLFNDIKGAYKYFCKALICSPTCSVALENYGFDCSICQTKCILDCDDGCLGCLYDLYNSNNYDDDVAAIDGF
jgi:hypothetical protein